MLRRGAAKELEYGRVPGAFDVTIVNDDLETAFQQLVAQLRPFYPTLKL